MTYDNWKTRSPDDGHYDPAADEGEEAMNDNPTVTDDDHSEITVTLAGRELRGWSYKDESERRMKMIAAREYVEGWCDGRETTNGR